MEPVKCSDCGFLAIRHKFDRRLLEAEDGLRQSCQFPPIEGAEKYEPRPLCSKGAHEIRKEMKDSSTEQILQAINRPRPCVTFMKWQPGYSPREHQEMLDEKWKREREESQDRETKRFQAEQSALAHKRHKESLMFSAITSMLAASLGAGATLLAVKIGAPPQPIINVVAPIHDAEKRPSTPSNPTEKPDVHQIESAPTNPASSEPDPACRP